MMKPTRKITDNLPLSKLVIAIVLTACIKVGKGLPVEKCAKAASDDIMLAIRRKLR